VIQYFAFDLEVRRFSYQAEKSRAFGFQIDRITSFNWLSLPVMIWLRRQRRRNQDLQPWRELEIGPALNKTLESILRLERMMTRKGVSFPAGGSLLLIGRKSLIPL
jgi:hypothetical protein